MAAALNATLNFSRLDDLIADLLLRPPGNAWQALRPFAGRYAIYLGDPLSPRPEFLTQALTFAESWNGIDSTGLTRDLTWTETSGTAWGITNNRARCAGNVGTNEARAEVDTATDSHAVAAELSTFTYATASLFLGLILRHPGDATQSYYRAYSLNTGHLLQKKVLGAITDLANDTSIPTGGVRVSATAVGSSISMTYGPSGLGPVTDMAITGYTRAGITFYSDNAGNVGAFDDWSIQDVMPSLRNMTRARFPIQKLATGLKGRSR